MRKLFIPALIVAAMVALLLPGLLSAQDATRQVKVQLTSTADVDEGELYIDGVRHGMVRKNIAYTVNLTVGDHSFAMRTVVNGVEYKREKNEAITAGSTVQWVFIHPIRQGATAASGTREVKIQLTSSADVNEGTLFIDGVNRGTVSKATPTIVSLSLGTHKLGMQATVDGVEYKREKDVAITAGTSPQWEFLHPIRQGNAAASGTREVKIQLTSSAAVDEGMLFIDGVNRGTVRKSSPTIITLTLGTHKLAMTATVDGDQYKREKDVAIVAGTSPQWEFLHPIKQAGTTADPQKAYINVTMSSDSKVSKAKLTIGEKNYDEIQRGKTRKFWVAPGINHKVMLEREWNGKTYRAVEYITLQAGETRDITLNPVKVE